MPCHVAVVGSCNMDVFLRTPKLPRPGETLLGHGCQFGSGGKGANQAIAAARLGAAVTLVGRIGNDAFGQDLLRSYQTEGIDTLHVSRDPGESTGLAAIVVDDLAQNTIIVIAGANSRLSPADVENAFVALRSAQVLLCQCEVPLETSLAAFRCAKAAGIVTILNPAPALPLPDELLRLTDYLVPNESELEVLAGQRVTTLAAAEAAGRKMLRASQGPRAVLVTLGQRGVLKVEPERADHLLAPTVQAVDTTGAGDAFVGSLAVALAEGRMLREAVPFACAAASLSVTRRGTQSSFPRRSEVEQFLELLRGQPAEP